MKITRKNAPKNYLFDDLFEIGEDGREPNFFVGRGVWMAAIRHPLDSIALLVKKLGSKINPNHFLSIRIRLDQRIHFLIIDALRIGSVSPHESSRKKFWRQPYGGR